MLPGPILGGGSHPRRDIDPSDLVAGQCEGDAPLSRPAAGVEDLAPWPASEQLAQGTDLILSWHIEATPSGSVVVPVRRVRRFDALRFRRHRPPPPGPTTTQLHNGTPHGYRKSRPLP